MIITDLTLITTAILTALMAGFFFSYSISVSLGLGKLGNKEFLEQHKNCIINIKSAFCNFNLCIHKIKIKELPLTMYYSIGQNGVPTTGVDGLAMLRGKMGVD